MKKETVTALRNAPKAAILMAHANAQINVKLDAMMMVHANVRMIVQMAAMMMGHV